MELIKIDLNNINIPENIVCCIGVFDGLHIGHQKVINQTIELGIKKNLKTAIITFNPHPDYVLNKVRVEKYVMSLEEKITIIKNQYKLDYFIVINFTKQLASLSYIDFYNLFLKNVNSIIIGEGFKFGYKNQGDVSCLKKLHCDENKEVIAVEHLNYDNQNHKVSTQRIINLIKDGQVKYINQLGIYYKIKGVVSNGTKLGRKIGYPTANIYLDDTYYKMKNGVYSVIVDIDNIKYLGIANYGFNPSFNTIDKPRLEVHIFNFNQNIYNKQIVVEFLDFIREEKKFASIDEFLKQIELDCKKCKEEYGGTYEIINCGGNGQ